MALRLSSHLLVGLSRIYTRKVHFLFTDCNEALSKITMVPRLPRFPQSRAFDTHHTTACGDGAVPPPIEGAHMAKRTGGSTLHLHRTFALAQGHTTLGQSLSLSPRHVGSGQDRRG